MFLLVTQLHTSSLLIFGGYFTQSFYKLYSSIVKQSVGYVKKIIMQHYRYSNSIKIYTVCYINFINILLLRIVCELSWYVFLIRYIMENSE